MTQRRILVNMSWTENSPLLSSFDQLFWGEKKHLKLIFLIYLALKTDSSQHSNCRFNCIKYSIFKKVLKYIQYMVWEQAKCVPSDHTVNSMMSSQWQKYNIIYKYTFNPSLKALTTALSSFKTTHIKIVSCFRRKIELLSSCRRSVFLAILHKWVEMIPKLF